MQIDTVHVRRDDAQHVVATARAFSLTSPARRSDATAGFTPVETLVSALGPCWPTSLQMVAELSGVPGTDMAIHLSGVRRDQPPQAAWVTYE